MGVITLSLLLALTLPQGSTAAQAPKPEAAPRPGSGASPVEFDPKTGWPKVARTTPRTEPAPRTEPSPAPTGEIAPAPMGEMAPATPRPTPVAASSPLPRVFQVVQSPDAFAALGGVTVYWRITVYGPQGEPIGLREVTQVADLARADRDRLDFPDGRTCGRLGAEVYAERHGTPWQTMVPGATQELALFGMQLRLPWAFADRRSYDELSAEAATVAGEVGTRVRLQKHVEDGVLGPRPTAVSVDQFELWCEQSSGLPRQLTYTLASAGQQRTVRLEDWRRVRDGSELQLPFRRVYVDEQGRATTALEILSIKAGTPVSERDFRLH